MFDRAWHRLIVIALLFCAPLFAQTQSEVLHTDDFQSYGTQGNPPGWIDTSIGKPKPTAGGLYKTWPDPLQGNQGANIVYGTKQSSGKPEGRNPRIGTFSTFASKEFAAKGRFGYSGRFIRTNADSRIGLTFLSAYPEKDQYYLAGLWSQNGTAKLTMQLFAFGAGALAGTLDSNFTPEPNKWYRFSIEVDDTSGATRMRARFWLDGTTEPTTWMLDAVDASATRLTRGRIGLWAAVKGDAYIDDVHAKSPVDHTPPTIEFVDLATNTVLDPAVRAMFRAPARIEIRVTDDLSSRSYEAQLDGSQFISGTPIATDGPHRITAVATDGVGNRAESALDLLIDQQPPVIALFGDGAPLLDDAVFAQDVTLTATVTDITTAPPRATLGANEISLPWPVAEEARHTFTVSATDALAWTSSATRSFFVDKTPPVITILANGEPLGGNASFRDDVTLTWSATDLTRRNVTATLNGVAVQSPLQITAEQAHELIVTADDRANHTTAETRRFVYDETSPEVTLLGNGVPFRGGEFYDVPVKFTLEVNDTTDTADTVTIDGAGYTVNSAYSTEGLHQIRVVVRNAAGLESIIGPLPFTVDLTPPAIALTESGQPFTDAMKFNRDVNPVVTSTDNITTSPVRKLTLNGVEYGLDTAITAESASHVIAASVTDEAGHTTATGPFRFMLDKTKPVVTIVEAESGEPFAPDALFARPVAFRVVVADLTKTTATATLNGATFSLGAGIEQEDGTVVYSPAAIATEGTLTIAVVATDELNWQNEPVTATFTIDTTPPAIVFTAHTNKQVVSTPILVTAGNSDDAVTMTVNAAAAVIDAGAKTFSSAQLQMVEGNNTITAIGTDAAGNIGTAAIEVVLDTRSPQLAITAPAAGVCLDVQSLEVQGTVSDDRLDAIAVTIGATTVPATIDGTSWSATIPVTAGRHLISVRATDSLGHEVTVTREVTIDRTAPTIEVLESGAPFTATILNRPLSLLIRAADATVTATLDGQPYTPGMSVATEGAHTLVVHASDCAGHVADRTMNFTLDFTPPAIRNLAPANGATLGTLPNSIAGSTDADAIRIELVARSLRATPASDATFVLNGVPFAEGLNRFTLRAIDRAGNSSELPYAVTVKTSAPGVEILEGGAPIPANALFARAITPVIRTDDPEASLTATLNGASFAPGATIADDGNYTLVARATDARQHTGEATATFTIDRTPPVITITAPANGAAFDQDAIEVRGNAGDSVSATVNGIAVTLAANGDFVLPSFALERGENVLVAIGRDRAGNAGRADVTVTRRGSGPGVVLTYPPDGSTTNRPATEVLGRVLTPSSVKRVTIGTQTVPVDLTGAFRLSAYALAEGPNAITATATGHDDKSVSATVDVTADFTPPSLTILESEQPLADGARFAERAVISFAAADNSGSPTTDASIDGTATTSPTTTITAAGGHIVTATARDLAGNETRAERTFFIGATGTSSGRCELSGFDPIDGAVILTHSTTLVGRFVNGVGVRVNDRDATVLDGSFLATVELPLEGANQVRLLCTDANGAPSGDPVTLTLHRVTGQLSITIDTPAEGFVTAEETINVTGTVGAGVTAAEVNGQQAVISGSDTGTTRSYTVTGMRLASGLNVLVARGRDGAGRVATASRRGTWLKSAPAISIATPSAGLITGTTTINVAGTFASVDAATIRATNVTANGSPIAADTREWSDTTGAYSAAVPLIPGKQTLRVSGRDSAGREATATVEVTRDVAAPSIAISTPLDHAWFGPAHGDTFSVSGTFTAAPGARVEVNGTAATVDGSSYDAASIPFLTLAGGVTPVVARVTDPSGSSASATIIVTRLVVAPKVIEAFPGKEATEVDPGALVLVLFSAPMDRTTLPSAFRLEEIGGGPVTGAMHLDKDVLTFAPAALLARGKSYRIVVTTAAKDLAGTPLDAEYTGTFTVAAGAAATAPTVNPIGGATCGESLEVTGTATPGARVRLEAGGIIIPAVANSAGAFRFTLPVSGQSGYLVLRVRTVAADGSVSPAAEIQARIDCSGPRVVAASFDRNTNLLTLHFSEPVLASTITAASILVTHADGHTVAAQHVVASNVVTITPSEDLKQASFSLGVTTAVTDPLGNRLVAPYSQSFDVSTPEPQPGDGSGFLSGEVYDATTGRPLASASIAVEVAGAPFTASSDARGRYLLRLPEGAHTIAVSRAGYTTVWRQILVPAGAGVVPIDIRLTRRADAQTSTGAAMTVTHGGDTAITRPFELTIPAGGLSANGSIAATAIGAQALPGLLPIGWSPLAAAEIVLDDANALSGATLSFSVPASDINAAAQNLTAVRYDSLRDEWTVLAAAVNVSADKASFGIPGAGSYALVYADRAPLAVPPLAVNGAALRGAALPATAQPLIKRAFTLDPAVVLPTGRAVARLEVEGAADALYPSGTAVQAYIDEELHLADGSRLLDPPFATDLLLYRNLNGSIGVADFHLAPSPRAAEVILEIGFDHIRILPYAGRLDRGTLIGAEGGRVPGDDRVSIDIPTGAAPEPLRATAASLSQSDLTAIGTIPGFRILGGVRFTLQRAVEPAPRDVDGDGANDAVPPLALFTPARATFAISSNAQQVILAELLDDTPYGRIVRLAARMTRIDGERFTTETIDRSQLPLDGILREGRYLLLAAERPIAIGTGTLRLGEGGRFLLGARISPNDLGVTDLTRSDGIFNVPVLATPESPFRLVPRHTSTGDGATYTHNSAPAANAVVRIELVLAPQAPAIASVSVSNAANNSVALARNTLATGISLATTVRVSFDRDLDAASIDTNTIAVAGADGATTFDGARGLTWTLKPGARLQAKTSYSVRIGSVRATNGASSTSASYAFETVAELRNDQVQADRIRITIPDASGKSRVIGAAGALPAGWQAVSVRRGVDFIERYQATAANDGSFSFELGQGHPRDRIRLTDLIDLQAINAAGNIAAIIPLTPFVSEDGRAFVARPDVATRYVSADGIVLDVEAGTFDVPTTIALAREQKSAFDGIPRLDEEVNFVAGVRVQFEGTARKRMQLSIAIPSGTDTNRNFVLAERGESTRGARLWAIDTMRIAGSTLTTAPEATASLRANANAVRANATLTGDQVKKYLYGLSRSGIFMVLDIRVPTGGSVGWAAMDAFQFGYDLFWDTLASFYVPQVYMVERGRVVIPIIGGKAFTVVGVDAATGLTAFTKSYDPIVIGDPGAAVIIDNPQQNAAGPYPVFGTPFRVELVDLSAEEVEIESVRNFKLELSNERVQVTPGDDPLDAETSVQLLNVSSGAFTSGTAGTPMTVEAKLGDRLALFIAEQNVDPLTSLSVVFSEAIYVEGDTADEIDQFLHDQLVLRRAQIPKEGQAPLFTDISDQARFEVDSGGRRITITLPSSLARESIYRLTIRASLADRAGSPDAPQPGLRLGQSTIEQDGELEVVGGGHDLELELRVRKPGGKVASFDIRQSEDASFGTVRDLALNGNLLFVTALDGGVLAYDTADPASLDGTSGTQPMPIAHVRGRESDDSGSNDYWGVVSDPHGRVYVTGQTVATGFLRSYRIEDFLEANQAGSSECSALPNVVCRARSSALISWRLGYSSSLGIGSETFLSDRPESIPRKVQVLLQDDEQSFDGLEAFKNATGATVGRTFANGIRELRAQFATDSRNPYLLQRVTVENVTLDLRWSADATPAGPANIVNIIARDGDRIRVIRNQRTYGVVSHYGFGIGVYDLNAIESNDYKPLPDDWTPLKEQTALTAAMNDPACFVPYTSDPKPPDWAIQDLSLSAEAVVRGDPQSGHLKVYAPDGRQGLLDLDVDPAKQRKPRTIFEPEEPECDVRSTEGLILAAPFAAEGVVDRIRALGDAFEARAGRPAVARFNSVANFSWRIEAQDNAAGVRNSEPNQDASRDYVLMTGLDYGVIVVEVAATPEHTVIPYRPLENFHIADIIYISTGAVAVRAVPRTSLATVVDREGRVLLLDLSRLDERFTEQGTLLAPDQLFPSAAKALAGNPTSPGAVGADDPRVIWKSEPGMVNGSLAPVFDPETGMLYAGQLSQKKINVVAAIDPTIRMKVDLGDENGLSEVSGVVPLGLEPPARIKQQIEALPPCTGTNPRCRENASLGAFRLEVSLPGAIAEALTASNQELQIAIESERVFDAPSEQTPEGFPRAHLRRFTRDGVQEKPSRAATKFRLERVIPDDVELKKKLRHQRGFNKFISPWVIALADPRASAKYDWGNADAEAKAKAGCKFCERPRHLEDASENDGVYELWTNGRILAVRPEAVPNAPDGTIFTGTKYAWLGDDGRFTTRFATILADTVRPTEVLVAGQNAPIARGALQERLYVHSGELESSALDLDAGGRAGSNVVLDRTYRSRSIGSGLLGQGWTSSLFQRLRALPNGNVEYRDGAGEVWLFEQKNNDRAYESPKGLFLKLVRDARGGWTLQDQQWRIATFDELGRIVSQSDEFYDSAKLDAGLGNGNVVRYLYDREGRLAQIVDPVGRATRLAYWKNEESSEAGAYPGLLKEVKDWRERTVLYEYDDDARLVRVKLPEVAAGPGAPGEFTFTGGNRPRIEYDYLAAQAPASTNPGVDPLFRPYLERSGNLESITDPDEVADTKKARVRFTYGGPGNDRVVEQQWATGEEATIAYDASSTSITDVLGAKWLYAYTPSDDPKKRAQVSQLTVSGTPAVDIGEGAPVPPIARPGGDVTLETKFTYDEQGQIDTADYPNGLKVDNEYEKAGGGAPGMVLVRATRTGPGIPSDLVRLIYDKQDSNAAATPVSIERKSGDDDAETRDAESPSRVRPIIRKADDGVTKTTKYSPTGQVESIEIGEGDTPSRATKMRYFADNASELLARGRVFSVEAADARTLYVYARTPNGGWKVTSTDERGAVTEIAYDSHDREVHRLVRGAGGQTLSDVITAYDAAGRAVFSSRKQKDAGLVVARTAYDAIGRELESTLSGAEVNGSSATVTSTTKYELGHGSRRITITDPAGATEVRELDELGRPQTVTRTGGDATVTRLYGYERGGQLAWESDGIRQSVFVRSDALGRTADVITSDGLRTTTRYNAWGSPRMELRYDLSGAEVSRKRFVYSRDGRLRSIGESIAGEKARQTWFNWTDGDRKRMVMIGASGDVDAFGPPTSDVRGTVTTIDAAGRVSETRAGTPATTSGDIDGAGLFAKTRYAYIGFDPVTTFIEEPLSGAVSTSSTIFDGLHRPVEMIQSGGSDTSRREYDEAGNITLFKAEGLAPERFTYDSRGLVQTRTLSDGKQLHFVYDALGVLRERRDESGESTRYVTDGIGRVTRIEYPDNTTEEVQYEAGSGTVLARKDRAGRWLSYSYDGGGRVLAVRSGQGDGGEVVLRYEYDPVGRLKVARNADAAVEYADYDGLNRPSTTRSYRYANGSGVSDAPVLLDVHTQRHEYSVHDERDAWTMPAGGQLAADSGAGPWLSKIIEHRDAGSNLVSQITPDGVLLTSATGIAVSKISQRQRAIDGTHVSTKYGYFDGVSDTSGVELPGGGGNAKSMLPRWAVSSVGGTNVAGSAVARDASNRITATRSHGLGDRGGSFRYDARGRLEHSFLDMAGDVASATPIVESIIDADFRGGRAVASSLSPQQRQVLGEAARSLEPQTWTATRLPAQQIGTRSVGNESPATLQYEFTGGQRTSDGTWTSQFDEYDRLVAISTADRRIEYDWDPNDRLVGRRALRPSGNDWVTEDRLGVLASDGLPASTTFVWDPVADRLVSIFLQGASTQTNAPPHAGLLRQYVHGDQAYDDPVRVLAATNGTVRTYIPLVDEAGTGSLEAVLDEQGRLVERVLYADAYGDAPRYLHGPVVDRIGIEAKKDSSDQLSEVRVRVHFSERLESASVAAGMHLRVLSAGEQVLATHAAAPALSTDGFTAEWTLNSGQWTALTNVAEAASLEIAVGKSLRATRWGDVSPTPAPAWALDLYGVRSNADYPVIKRESLSSLTSFFASAPSGQPASRELYNLPGLYAGASSDSHTSLFFDFHALPFREPATGLAYARARWYDPATGTFLTPDALGYVGSSNLYAGFNADPINTRDPNGREPITLTAAALYVVWSAVNTTADVGIDYLFHLWLAEEGEEFDVWKSARTNMALNLATGGIGGKVAKLRYLRHLKNPLARKAAAETLEYVADVGVTGTVEMAGGQSAGEAFGGAAVGGLVGRGAAYGGKALLRGVDDPPFFRGLGDETTSPALNDKRTAVRVHVEDFREGASYLIPESSYLEYVVGGKLLIGDPTGQFASTTRAMDRMLAEANGDLEYVKYKIGIEKKYWNEPLYRVDVANPLLHDARLPTGRERGAGKLFRWGGYSSGGMPEIVLGQIPLGEYRSSYTGVRPKP